MYTVVHIVPIVQDFLREDNCRTSGSGPFATLAFHLEPVFKLC